MIQNQNDFIKRGQSSHHQNYSPFNELVESTNKYDQISSNSNSYNIHKQSQILSHLSDIEAHTAITLTTHAHVLPKIKENVEISEFIVEGNNEHEHEDEENESEKLLANLARIRNCKNEAESALSQVEQYLSMIRKLQIENKKLKNTLKNRDNEMREMRSLIHIKDMEMVEMTENCERIKRMYYIESAKNKIRKQEYDRVQQRKWEDMMLTNLEVSNSEFDHHEYEEIKYESPEHPSTSKFSQRIKSCSKISYNPFLNDQSSGKIRQSINYNPENRERLKEGERSTININKFLQVNSTKQKGHIVKNNRINVSMKYCQLEDESTFI